MKLNIIVTTDIHGNIFPTNYTSRENIESYGLSRISTAIKEARLKGPILLLDNGDSFQGTPLLTYAHMHPNEYMNPMAQAFNALNYDYINLGNHDFNYGPDILKKYIHENKAKLLTSNVLLNGEPIGQSQIIDYQGKKIALIGVLTHYIPNWERPSHIENFEFKDAYETMKSEVERLRDHVDFVVGMYHGGLERDPQSGEPTERLTGENQGYEMTQIKGLDLLLTGHQHRSLSEVVHGVPITQCAFKGQEFATASIDLDSREIHTELHQTSDYAIDTDLLKPFDTLQETVQEWLDQPVGSLQDGPLHIDDEFDARVHKHPLVSLINQVQLDRAQAQLSSVALFNGTKGFNQTITMRDLVSTYLYPNTLVVKKISGKNLREMLEFTAHYFTLDSDGEIIASPEYVSPKPQHYNYDMVDGIDYTIDVSKPRGSRITSLTYQGQAVKDEDSFKLVTNNYRAMGGGNYTMVSESETLEEIQEEMIDTIMEYLVKYSPVVVNHSDNITVTK